MASLPLSLVEADFEHSPPIIYDVVPTPANDVSTGERSRNEARLSSFDWSIVALAERDGLSSLREPGRLAKAFEALFGLRQPNKLANSRSETLRRVAVFAWRRGWKVPQSELDAFVEAGFTLDQYELIQASIARSREGIKARRRGQ